MVQCLQGKVKQQWNEPDTKAESKSQAKRYFNPKRENKNISQSFPSSLSRVKLLKKKSHRFRSYISKGKNIINSTSWILGLRVEYIKKLKKFGRERPATKSYPRLGSFMIVDSFLANIPFQNPLNPISTNPTKWSDTRLWPTNCLSVFDHFIRLSLKGLKHQKTCL